MASGHYGNFELGVVLIAASMIAAGEQDLA